MIAPLARWHAQLVCLPARLPSEGALAVLMVARSDERRRRGCRRAWMSAFDARPRTAVVYPEAPEMSRRSANAVKRSRGWAWCTGTALLGLSVTAQADMGPLRVHSQNGRYF